MSEDGVRIRKMTAADHESLIKLWMNFQGNTLTGADSSEGFVKFLEKNSKYCFVAVEEKKVVGSVMAGSDQRRGYIYHLAVDESLQGKNIGKRLMDVSENALRDSGIEKVHLFIYKDNPATRFYEKTGWHRRSDIIVMSKVLLGNKYMGTRIEEN